MVTSRERRKAWLRRGALAAAALAVMADSVERALAAPRQQCRRRRAARTIAGATLPAGFQDQIAFSGLTFPTAVRFASDGHVFVAEKSGLLEEFDSLSDSSPTQVADFRPADR